MLYKNIVHQHFSNAINNHQFIGGRQERSGRKSMNQIRRNYNIIYYNNLQKNRQVQNILDVFPGFQDKTFSCTDAILCNRTAVIVRLIFYLNYLSVNSDHNDTASGARFDTAPPALRSFAPPHLIIAVSTKCHH